MRMLRSVLAAGLLATTALVPAWSADHGDAPYASVKHSADIGDVYLFLDPNDNSRVVVILTVAGFTVPGEGVNFSVFDDELLFRFLFETNGNAVQDQVIRVRFSRKTTSGATPQMATVTLPNGRQFQAPTTSSNLSDTPPTPTITEGLRGIKFFAGSADDPFFFDIPGFARFVTSAVGGTPDPSQLERGRDSFAGYNTLAIAMSIPVEFFGRLKDNVLGVAAAVSNPSVTDKRRQQIDLAGNPGVQVVFVPFDLDDVFNRSSTLRNSQGRIPNAILATLGVLGTNQAGIDLLTDLVVSRGDYLRVDTTIPNIGPGGGDNAGAGFPNGRRLGDDVIDTVLTVVTNGAVTSDNVDDVTGDRRRNEFPFLAPPIQPFPPTNPAGTLASSVDDLTEN